VSSCRVSSYRAKYPIVSRTIGGSASPVSPLPSAPKIFHPKKDLQQLLTSIHKISEEEYEYEDGKQHNKNDGIIFTPESANYLCKGVATLLKWKWPTLNTIDFLKCTPWFDTIGQLKLYADAEPLISAIRSSSSYSSIAVHIRSTILTAAKKAWFLCNVGERSNATVETCYDPQNSNLFDADCKRLSPLLCFVYLECS
jgi:hypothetical protein